MSKAAPEVLARVALAAWLVAGFHNPRETVRSSARAGDGVRRIKRQERRHMTWQAYPSWLTPGDNAWQMTAATLVGLMSVPGLAVLYGGAMQKRWSINSMMLTFAAV